MLDHIGLRIQNVKDVQKLKSFYVAALKPLGYEVVMEFGGEHNIGYVGVGLGVDKKPDFWIGAASDGTSSQTGAMHIAFVAKDRPTVDAFYKAALAAGAKDNGPPGPRPQYHPGYYGAFVIDPAGNNLEACCHKPA